MNDKKQFKMASDYNEVSSRIQEFREKHPEGSLQQVSMTFETVGGKDWVVYTAAAYRTPDDERPGIGTAWEPIPGRTPYTKDSEVQNAETAAWGRALIAVGAADAKKGIASADEMRPRQEEQSEATKPRTSEYKRLHADGDRARKNVSEPDLRQMWDEAQLCASEGSITPYEHELLANRVRVLRVEIKRAEETLAEAGGSS